MNTFICEAAAIFIKEVMCMTNYREILRLDSIYRVEQDGDRFECGCSRNTVAGALKRAAECGLSWPLPADMSDQQLAGILYPSVAGKPEYRMPDYEYVYRAVFKIFCKQANCDAQMIPGA